MCENRIGDYLYKYKEQLNEERDKLGIALAELLNKFENFTGIEILSLLCEWTEEKSGGGDLDPIIKKRKIIIELDV
jgi:hypothetical protein